MWEGRESRPQSTNFMLPLTKALSTSTQVIVNHTLQLAGIQFSANSEPVVLWCTFCCCCYIYSHISFLSQTGGQILP